LLKHPGKTGKCLSLDVIYKPLAISLAGYSKAGIELFGGLSSRTGKAFICTENTDFIGSERYFSEFF